MELRAWKLFQFHSISPGCVYHASTKQLRWSQLKHARARTNQSWDAAVFMINNHCYGVVVIGCLDDSSTLERWRTDIPSVSHPRPEKVILFLLMRVIALKRGAIGMGAFRPPFWHQVHTVGRTLRAGAAHCSALIVQAGNQLGLQGGGFVCTHTPC